MPYEWYEKRWTFLIFQGVFVPGDRYLINQPKCFGQVLESGFPLTNPPNFREIMVSKSRLTGGELQIKLMNRLQMKFGPRAMRRIVNSWNYIPTAYC